STLMPNQLNDKKVYLRVTGTEASKIELETPLKKALEQRGVTLVNSAEDARFYLHVNTLFADNLKEAMNLNAALMGGVAAGAISTVNHSGGDSLLIGVGVALAMGITDRALADETYRAIINIALSEKNATINTEWNNPQETRLLVEAVRMNLDLEEAKPVMEEKASYQIAEIFK
ncbi:MAG: hypothetical protein EOM50_17230, partial [Erysipelotrichia bacterium]|nr:hypothetical protein [Erysipelotrichia bacterium]